MAEALKSRGQLWTGRIMSGFVELFLLVDGGARLAGFAPYVEGMTKFGYSASLAPWVGLTLLICTLLYIIPRTSVLGAILITGYLGGAIATHVRAESPLFSSTLFGVYLALMVWGGLWLRLPEVRALIPFTQTKD